MGFAVATDRALLRELCEDVLDPARGGDPWQRACAAGLPGLLFAEELGGAGGGALEAAIVLESLGRYLVREPYHTSAVLCAALLQSAASEAQLRAWAPAAMAGSERYAFAGDEPGCAGAPERIALRARPVAGGYALAGRKTAVLDAEAARYWLVSARVPGRDGLALLRVPRAAEGVRVEGYPTPDGRRAADLSFAEAFVAEGELLAGPGDALPAVEHALELAAATVCAEAVGCMAALHETTLAYVRARRQFGSALARFQAVQHRLVEMLLELEMARSLTLAANAALAAGAPAGQLRRAVSAAKVRVGRAGRFVAQGAIQLHGAIGMAEELPLGRYARRLAAIDAAYGTPARHLARFAEALPG
ncbi:MAG: hypothetical protein QOI11_641 [Candidatus Eremiobacteraeota bacterium]|jgi:pimeloyl-CoA dehydrogenase|nr:hypothetical protein [Candidatus Eremiobacteraeota bacterium]